jgi:hypothetical protein
LYVFLSLLYVAYTSWGFFFRPLLRFIYDETLPIINKSKHPKKGGNTRKKKGRTHIQEDIRATKREQTTRNIKFPNPLLPREAYQVCLALAWLSLLSKNLRSRSKRLILSYVQEAQASSFFLPRNFSDTADRP